MPAKSPVKKEWSMFAYIAGDNDLSDYALSDVTEMCKTGSADHLHVSVQIDTQGDHDGLIRYEITEPDHTGKGYRKVIQRLSETNSGSPECLSSFLKFGLKRYPSKNKIAVVWSHGSGFKAVNRDIGFDDSSRSASMDMNEIISALKKGGINSRNKVQILGFDACLMAMLEVAHHFIDHAEILVGSQQTEPGNGWPYDKVLRLMKKNTLGHKIAEGIVNEYISYYKRTHQSDVTQAAINLSKTQDAINSLSTLGTYLKNNLNGIKGKINQTRVQSQNFEYADYIDLIDFCNNLKKSVKDPKMNVIVNDVITKTKNCIIHAGAYGRGVKNANGLSVWFPGRKELYVDNRSKYKKLKCNEKRSGWLEFLDEYYS
jgi:hypothetical protein